MRQSILIRIVILSTVSMLSLTIVFSAKSAPALAASHDTLTVKTLKIGNTTVKRYDTTQVLALPGIHIVKITKTQTMTPKTSIHPNTTSMVYAESLVNWVYYDGSFFCGYAVGIGWVNQGLASVSEMGDLYINGNYTDGTDSVWFGSTQDETACYEGGSNTLWEFFVSAAASWIFGGQAFAVADALGYQP